MQEQRLKFYLLDLERTISCRVPFYWKSNKHGYTTRIEEAGLYFKEIAEKIVESDLDKTTVIIPEKVVSRILKSEEFFAHETRSN